MSATALAQPGEVARAQTRPRAFETITYGGLAVGLLDGAFALVFYGMILGVPKLRIFQSVASGLLGRASFDGGVRTFLVGILLHFCVAACVAAVYYALARALPVMIRHAVAGGLIYGVVAYFVMNYVVIPLSAAARGRFAWHVFLPAVIGHAFLVGLPVALIARRSARASRAGRQSATG